MCKALPFTWTNTIVLFCTFLSIGIGIVNNRRILARGKGPGKRFAAAGLTETESEQKASKTNP